MSKMIKIGMAELDICLPPDAITTLGLGSCVGVVLYDPTKKICGMVHVMLPDSTKIKNNENAYMPQEILDKCEEYKSLDGDDLKLYEKIWMQIKG